MAGIGLLGISVAIIMNPIIPIIIEAVKRKEFLNENPILNDKVASIFSIAHTLGSCLGPLIGGFIRDLVKTRSDDGYRKVSDIMAISSLIISLFYLTQFIFS